MKAVTDDMMMLGKEHFALLDLLSGYLSNCALSPENFEFFIWKYYIFLHFLHTFEQFLNLQQLTEYAETLWVTITVTIAIGTVLLIDFIHWLVGEP